MFLSDQIRSVAQSCPTLCNPMIAARQASLSNTNSRSSLRLMSIESVMPSSHLILCRPLLLLPPIPPSIRVFSNELTLRMRWPKYWSFSFSIIPSKEIPGLISFRMFLPRSSKCFLHFLLILLFPWGEAFHFYLPSTARVSLLFLGFPSRVWYLKVRISRSHKHSQLMSQPRLLTNVFIQQILIEYLLCARHYCSH